MKDGQRITVVIPALNEANAINRVIEEIPAWVDQIIVADNGSTDGTPEVAEAHGATVVHEPRCGYGAACLRGLAAVHQPDIVVFLDADYSDFPGQMDRLIEPIARNKADLVIGSRTMQRAEAGALTLPQRLGNALASVLLRRIWRQPCSDLGPFRAIRFDALQSLQMDDLGFGWTVQMQVRALKQHMRVVETPVAYRKRIGKSKISGTVRGVIGAGTKILTTIAREALIPAGKPFQRHRLIVFARYPEPGTTKTRLIPALGEQGAADLQLRMNHHTFNVARRWADRAGRQIEVRFTGGTPAQMAETFGSDMNYIDQGQDDLGERLNRAFEDAATAGVDAAIAIGTDCPQLDKSTISSAFEALEQHEVALGPASDGGYYLIGMRRPHPGLFDTIDWGSQRVLEQTRQRIDQLGLSASLLSVKDDVDEPDDLSVWERAESLVTRYAKPRFSVVIPARNEADSIADTLASIGQAPDTEILVADGESEDPTPEIVRTYQARIISSTPGRSRQLNAGAAAACGEILIFLHADTRLPFAWREQIAEVLADTKTVGGAFHLGFDDARLSLRVIEAGANLRSRLVRLPYGDQVLFVQRTVFQKLGGFKELAVMEDYEFVRRLRRVGPIRLEHGSVLTSPRRWLARGIIRTTLTHQLMIAGYHLGIATDKLAGWRAAPSSRPACTGISPATTTPDKPISSHHGSEGMNHGRTSDNPSQRT